MKHITSLLFLSAICHLAAMSQDTKAKRDSKLSPSKVDFDAYDSLVQEVKQYRKDRLVNLQTFLAYAKEPNTVILDTRSEKMYKRKHVKGAIHLNFSDFTQENLRRLIPSPATRILIYCNNNFDGDQVAFATKSSRPTVKTKKEVTLALNIPTFINLYGYGYKNVYELSDLVSVFSTGILFEGTDVLSPVSTAATTQKPATITR